MANPDHARQITFDGAKNVRDLGGLPVAGGGATRFGVIYRGDGLSRLSDADVKRLADLGIRSVVDLRYDEERERAPDRFSATHTPKIFCRGFLPRGSVELFKAVNDHGADERTAFELMRTNYARIPFEHAPEFRDVMHYLVSPGAAPHLVHCTSGKDRTGIVVAFVLRALGVQVDDIVTDYEMSNGDFQPVDIFAPTARADAIAVVMAARAEYILASLDAIDARHGSFDRYLEVELGFGRDDRETLAHLMLA